MECDNLFNTYSVTQVAGTLASALGIAPPEHAVSSLAPVDELVKRSAKSGKVDKMLIYNPDAVAMWLYQKYTEYFMPVMKHTSLVLPMHTMMPSVTPVCFASIYSGAEPSVHGIQKYEKPVLKVDTLFDALARAGKKTAIIAVNECSIARIFLEREGIDYFITESDAKSKEKALKLIDSGEYDFLTVYNGSYDSEMHRTYPESETALDTLKKNAVDFDEVVTAAKAKWSGFDALYAFITDHGAHKNAAGRGSHGEHIPEDINIMHFYGVNG